ncbi:4-aminobutyrate--2-oxoglutarate transaminase [bacterium]|nr:4-aminobutyrate--2-oxoglutarate transaminase [bacterium]
MTTPTPRTNEDLVRRREAAIPRGPFQVGPVFVDRAEGARLWDVEGKEYIDFCGGIGVLNVGHNHPSVVEAIKRQADRFVHTCWHVAMYEPYLELAERLNELVPIDGACKTTFFNSGAEAVENAVKIARHATGRTAVVGFERGFHGRTLMGMTLTAKVMPYGKGFGPFAPGVHHLPWKPFFGPAPGATDDDLRACAKAALDHLFAYHVAADEVACVMLEPVLGEGGFYPVHPAALAVLQETCEAHGILVVADEVQAGFGRCGAMFASERVGMKPDLVTLAKSLAGGLPLSAVSGRAELMDAPHVGGIGGTYGGNPIGCAAALAVLDVMRDEGLPDRARRIGEVVMARFEELVEAHDHVIGAHGLGAMCGLEIGDPGSGEPDAGRTGRILATARDRGVLAMAASGNVIRTLMPLVISDGELTRALDILAASVADGA